MNFLCYRHDREIFIRHYEMRYNVGGVYNYPPLTAMFITSNIKDQSHESPQRQQSSIHKHKYSGLVSIDCKGDNYAFDLSAGIDQVAARNSTGKSPYLVEDLELAVNILFSSQQTSLYNYNLTQQANNTVNKHNLLHPPPPVSNVPGEVNKLPYIY